MLVPAAPAATPMPTLTVVTVARRNAGNGGLGGAGGNGQGGRFYNSGSKAEDDKGTYGGSLANGNTAAGGLGVTPKVRAGRSAR